MNIQQHWLTGIRHIPSPNCNARPNPADISLLVIHCISLPPGEYGGDYISHLFCNRLDPTAHPYFESVHQLEVSAHLLIRRDGECIQFVPFDQRAWHAGASHYQGREACNDFSIGIELEGTETELYTDLQYTRLAEVIRLLLAHYPKLSKQRITGHSDIAPGRKTDPGATFAWQRLHRLLGG